jgi:hypothetical protein
MARQSGYFPKTVQMTLAEMAYSGKIYAARKGREKHYRVDQAEWAVLRARGDPGTTWPNWEGWPQWFAAMTAVWRLAQDRELAEASASLQAAEWQKLMGRIQPWLAQTEPGAVVQEACFWAFHRCWRGLGFAGVTQMGRIVGGLTSYDYSHHSIPRTLTWPC